MNWEFYNSLPTEKLKRNYISTIIKNCYVMDIQDTPPNKKRDKEEHERLKEAERRMIKQFELLK